jgi:hypothetical protein
MVLDLHEDLKLDAFPATTSGKVKKSELAKIVQKYVHELSQTAISHDTDSTDQALEKIWSRISGAAISDISHHESVLT